MATLDTSMYGTLKPAEFENPLIAQGRLMQLMAAKDQQAMGALQRQQLERQLAREGRLAQLAQTTPAAQMPGELRKLGMFDEAARMEKAAIDNQKAQAEIGKTNAERSKIIAAGVRDLATQFDDNEAGYQAYVEAIRKTYGDESANRMAPTAVAGWQGKAIATADKMYDLQKPIMKEINDGQRTVFVDMNPVTNPAVRQLAIQMNMTPAQIAQDQRALQTLAEQQRHNRTNEGIAGGHLALARTREQREANAPRGQIDWDRGLIADPRDGTARPITQGGVPIGPKDKQPTEGEMASAGFAGRMQRAESLLSTLPRNADRPGFAEQGARAWGQETAANIAMSAPRQQYRQAQEDWVRAKLRKESGAVIPTDEMEREIRVYFPQIGDKPAVVEQKRLARAQAFEQFRSSSGRARIPANVNDRPGLSQFSGGRPPLDSFAR